MINSASMINIPFLEMKEGADALIAGGVRYFHIDLMDGHYVPNLCFPIDFIRQMKNAYPNVTMDIHIMVSNPVDYVERLKNAGADYVSFHTDSTPFVRRLLQNIHDAGMKAGVVINPSQRTDHILPFAHYLDLVTLMAVEPGFSGQPFLDGSMERLKELADIRRETKSSYMISVDGGVNREKCVKCREIGVDMIVGTRHNIFCQPDGILDACRRFESEFGLKKTM